jgi:hypothetical protein
MTFAEVQILAEKFGAARRALTSSSRANSRVELPDVGSSRHQSRVAPSADMDDSYVSGIVANRSTSGDPMIIAAAELALVGGVDG